MLPMYQSEALWINLSGGYPFAVKIAWWYCGRD